MNRGQVAEPSAELRFVLQLADEMKRLSAGGFSAVRPNDRRVDLSGVAKGFIVDRVAERLSFAMPDAEGCVNAAATCASSEMIGVKRLCGCDRICFGA